MPVDMIASRALMDEQNLLKSVTAGASFSKPHNSEIASSFVVDVMSLTHSAVNMSAICIIIEDHLFYKTLGSFLFPERLIGIMYSMPSAVRSADVTNHSPFSFFLMVISQTPVLSFP